MSIQIELILLALSLMFLLSILAGKASSRYGVPALLLFLSVGMFSGSDGLGIQFNNIGVAHTVSTIALCIILFSGGMDTKLGEIKPILWPGIVLATLGVFFTALITGALIWLIFGSVMASAGVSLLTSLLLASTMSSTDSASVFSILRSKGLHLKNNLRPMLELESGSNDPMAYILVITFVELIKMQGAINYWEAGGALIMQLVVGGVAGYILGRVSVKIINKLQIGNDSLYPILVLTLCIFIFSATYFIKGNSYLAVYVAGLVIGNSKFVHKRSSLHFFDGLAWLSQLLMFLTLGLLVNPRELLPIIVPGLVISVLMIFISRPLTVFLCLLPFKKIQFKDKAYISWVGLRGAVPIIFAIIPLVEDVPHARLMFNIVFFCTLVSLLVQGTSLPLMAKWLGLAEKPKEKVPALSEEDADPHSYKSATAEIQLSAAALKKGNKLMDLPIPLDVIVVLVKRDETLFVPTGTSELTAKDTLLVISDEGKELTDTINKLTQ